MDIDFVEPETLRGTSFFRLTTENVQMYLFIPSIVYSWFDFNDCLGKNLYRTILNIVYFLEFEFIYLHLSGLFV